VKTRIDGVQNSTFTNNTVSRRNTTQSITSIRKKSIYTNTPDKQQIKLVFNSQTWVHGSRIPPYNKAPASADTTIIPSIPRPALLTACGATTIEAAAPELSSAPGELVLDPPPLAVLSGFPVAVAVLFPLQKIEPGLTPLSMKHFCRSATLWSTERQ